MLHIYHFSLLSVILGSPSKDSIVSQPSPVCSDSAVVPVLSRMPPCSLRGEPWALYPKAGRPVCCHCCDHPGIWWRSWSAAFFFFFFVAALGLAKEGHPSLGQWNIVSLTGALSDALIISRIQPPPRQKCTKSASRLPTPTCPEIHSCSAPHTQRQSKNWVVLCSPPSRSWCPDPQLPFLPGSFSWRPRRRADHLPWCLCSLNLFFLPLPSILPAGVYVPFY